ncbi:hypothetical protein ALC60_03903 [Trachymyrmex zeteki]|uniref:DDE-1 domain-containing protein n=1 Tax=Mycetomoellerius zeteki TaxID=64791 RepID=A0A151X9P4_9HYME|nr:hypothetical protein ALC60_03903 [Trachymyrmex zeteki]
MTIEIFYEYICNIFYPWLKKNEIVFAVVLFVDGHSSHLTLPLSNFCREKQRLRNSGERLRKESFAPLIKNTLNSMDLSIMIKNGFRTCGLLPFSRLMKSTLMFYIKEKSRYKINKKIQ